MPAFISAEITPAFDNEPLVRRRAGAPIFDLYYDRRLEGRSLGGSWILWRELDTSDLDER